jgi:hypothetical protein
MLHARRIQYPCSLVTVAGRNIRNFGLGQNRCDLVAKISRCLTQLRPSVKQYVIKDPEQIIAIPLR